MCENVARFAPLCRGPRTAKEEILLFYMKLVALFAEAAMGHVTLSSCVWHLPLTVNHQLPR